MNFKNLLFGAVLLVGLASCDDDDPVPTIPDEEWEVALSTANEVDAPDSIGTETGTAMIELTGTNTLNYTFTVANLADDDTLTASHLHGAAAGSNGGVVLPLNTAIAATDTTVTGSIANIRSTLADSLRGSASIYINVHSKRFPNGLVRGQLQ